MLFNPLNYPMTSLLCIPLIGPTYSDLQVQLIKACFHADLVELRLDKMTHIELEQLRSLRKRFPVPMIFTLRKFSQGGDFKGSEQEHLQLLRCLLELEPEYMDIEANVLPSDIQSLKTISLQTKWIMSWHDFEETPMDLELLFQNMSLIPADYYKIATKANSICDSLRMLNLVKKVNAEKSLLCGLCMGEEGQCTRILGPVMNNPFTFAALESGQESAPGQLNVNTLLKTYHFRNLNSKTLIFGLIGDPIEASMSHLTHNAVFETLSINGIYVKFKVCSSELTEFIKLAEQLGVKGLSVTMPHKEALLSFITQESNVLDIGACNTLIFTENGLKGLNTDGIGALKAWPIEDVSNKKIVILGAGGAAKAIAYELSKKGACLTILNRTLTKAQNIALRLCCHYGTLEDFSKQDYEILIQATSIGMDPHLNDMPIPAEKLISHALVLDIISNPKETRLLREARLKGCQVGSGLEMFIQQAIAQFIFWFGEGIEQGLIEQTIRRYVCPITLPKQGLSVKKSRLQGSIVLPPSKSHSIRAVLLGAMADGKSFVRQPLKSPDVIQAIKAARQLGAVIQEHEDYLEIQGVSGKPQAPENVIDSGNSGQVLRFVGALAALSSHYTVITGDLSIRTNRLVQSLLDGLRLLGVFAESTRQNGYAPIIVKGPMRSGFTSLSGEDSQPVSALLMAAAFLEGETIIQVHNPGEKPWINLTLSWLERLGVSYQNEHFERLIIQGKQQRPGFHITIPGDFSSAAFPLVAALLTQSTLTIENVDMDDVQGDKALIFILQQMGAQIEIDAKKRCLYVKKGSCLRGQVIDINPIIDAITILAVVGCFAEGETVIINGSIARHKECDRIRCITTELKKMGANIVETKDGLIIRSSSLKGACVKSYQDHRMALSLIVAGLAAEGETEIDDIECMIKSYPTFITDMQKLGGAIK